MAIHPSLLQQFALMRLFSADDLASLAAHSSTHAFAKREVVLAKENPSSSLMFLLEGRLQAIDFTLDGREVGLHFIEEGQYFGEISVLDGLPSPEVVIANKKSQVIMVPAREVRLHIFANPSAIEAITSGLTQRIRDQANQRQILGIISPLQRICALLQNLSKDGLIASSIAMKNRPDYQLFLAKTKIPFLFIQGSEDTLISTDLIKEVLQDKAQHKLVILQDVGHQGQYEAPSACFEAINAFI